MKEVIIGTFNLRNHYWQRNWNGQNFPEILANFIKDEKITFLCVQEMVKPYSKKLQLQLNNYHIIGNYRFEKIPFPSQFNEANSIITKEKIIFTETKHLSRIPGLDHLTKWPRIITTIQTAEHFIINTHIEFGNKIPQIHQLKILYQYIHDHQDLSPIITGDFNIDSSTPHFLDFIKKLEKIGIQHINNSTPTHKKQIIDHIFISNTYDILSTEVIQNQAINDISDHSPLLVKIRKK